MVVLRGDREAWTAAYAALSNQARCDLTKHLLSKSKFSQRAKALIEEFVVQFSIVNENRNILLHAVVEWDEAGIKAIRKFSKTRLGQHVRYPYSLDEVARCLSEAERTLVFGTKVLLSELVGQFEALGISAADMKARHLGEHEAVLPPISSLERPPRPSKLKPLGPVGGQDGPTPPQSSEA